MTIETITPTPAIKLPPTDLIYDDGEPMESNRHRIAMNSLIRGVNQALAHRNDFFDYGEGELFGNTARLGSKTSW